MIRDRAARPSPFGILLILLSLMASGGCGEEGRGASSAEDSAARDAQMDTRDAQLDTRDSTSAETQTPDATDTTVALPPADDPARAPDCESAQRPVVVLHGLLASGDTFALQEMRFASNDYCLEDVHAFDWNSLGGPDASVEALDALVDSLAASSPDGRVDLAGHSAGGMLALTYMEDEARASKVAHYVHIGSNTNVTPPASVPMLNVYSRGDLLVSGQEDIEAAENLVLEDTSADHYQVATHVETFSAMYAFFNDGRAPETTEIEGGSARYVSGRALVLGDNRRVRDGRVQVYEVDPASGARKREAADITLATDDEGGWGPFIAEADAYYELVIRAEGRRPVHYYREPFAASTRLVRLRALPGRLTVAGALLSAIEYDDAHSVFATFTASQAALLGRDTMSVDDVDLTRPELMAPARTTIAIFHFDANANGLSDEVASDTFDAIGVFLAGFDLFVPASPECSVTFRFNDRALTARCWPSESEGVSIVVFD